LAPEVISDGERRTVVILAEGADLTITWSRFAPGERGPDLHVHHEHTDAFYVLGGRLTFELGPEGEPTTVGAGAFVAAPARVAHSFFSAGPGEARWLNFHAPDKGFADFLRTLRAGEPGRWDSFDVPADGGRPASDAVLATAVGEGVQAAGLRVAERAPDGAHDGPTVGPGRPDAAFAIAGGEVAIALPELGRVLLIATA
jgi:mannose-6-phosphate isomerase-like protein (cupin superfamily)